MQKSSIENSKDQWNQVYDYMMSMQDTFTESLPDELPALPGILGQLPVVSPKEFMKDLKEFQEMAKEYFVKQADSIVDVSIKSQEKVCDKVCKAIDNAKKEKDEQPAKKAKEKPAKKAKEEAIEAEVVEQPADK